MVISKFGNNHWAYIPNKENIHAGYFIKDWAGYIKINKLIRQWRIIIINSNIEYRERVSYKTNTGHYHRNHKTYPGGYDIDLFGMEKLNLEESGYDIRSKLNLWHKKIIRREPKYVYYIYDMHDNNKENGIL